MKRRHATLWMSLILLAWSTLIPWSAPTRADGIRLVTTDFPPYSYQIDGRVSGMATEIVLAACRQAGIAVTDIDFYPWARAYFNAQHQKNTLIFSIARTSDREERFKWVGKIAPYKVNLYKLKARKELKVASLEDAKRYRVGGEIGDVKQGYLLKQGFEVGKNLQLASTSKLNIRMLFARRIDLLPFSEFNLAPMVRAENFDPAELEAVLPLQDLSHELYLASSLDTPDALVERLQQALVLLERNGALADIRAQYLR